MANHKSAAKRARQAVRRTAVNNQRKSAVRTWERKLRSSIEAKKPAEAVELLKAFSAQMGKAVKVGLVHANCASRKVGRLASQVASLSK